MTDIARKEELAQARATASQIRQGIHNYLHTLTLIGKAHQQRHWQVLGYKDWQEYIDEEFGAERLRLPAEHRQKAIAELRLAGMSVRAIGTTLDMPKSSVADELAQLSEAGQLEQPETILGNDGRERPASRPSQPAPPPVEADAQLDAPVRTGVREDLDGAGTPDGSGDGDAEPTTAAPPTSPPAPSPAGGEVSPLVQAAMDKYAPDPNPHREWQKKFLADVHAVHKVMRYDVDTVAVQADSTCIEELGRVFELLDEYRSKVLAALQANLPDNVRPMRRSS